MGERGWAAGVLVVASAAGLLLGTSASTAAGSDLRPEQRDLAGLVRSGQLQLAALEARTAHARDRVAREEAASRPAATASTATDPGEAAATAVGLLPVHGPGVVVELDDAPRRGRPLPAGVAPDDVVVHQQDVQGVVDALWAGGAEAMQLMDQRVVATSAVRCVGNTLLLQGVVYSPPYRVAAIGDPQRLMATVDAHPGVALFRQYAAALGLGYRVTRADDLHLPAYTGTVAPRYAS